MAFRFDIPADQTLSRAEAIAHIVWQLGHAKTFLPNCHRGCNLGVYSLPRKWSCSARPVSNCCQHTPPKRAPAASAELWPPSGEIAQDWQRVAGLLALAVERGTFGGRAGGKPWEACRSGELRHCIDRPYCGHFSRRPPSQLPRCLPVAIATSFQISAAATCSRSPKRLWPNSTLKTWPRSRRS